MKAIINPAMIATWGFGLALAMIGGWFSSPWFHVKLVLVLVLSGLHGWMSVLLRAFAEDRNTHGARFYRVLNEAPTLLMIAIVILVVVKPFS